MDLFSRGPTGCGLAHSGVPLTVTLGDRVRLVVQVRWNMPATAEDVHGRLCIGSHCAANHLLQQYTIDYLEFKSNVHIVAIVVYPLLCDPGWL